MARRLEVRTDRLRLREPFRITGYVFEHMDVVVATIGEGGAEGRGEASGAYYLGDDVPRMLGEIEAARESIERGIGRAELQALLAPGGARNALDCALWELDAMLSGRPAWQLAGLEPPTPRITTLTLGADTPERMAARAETLDAKAIKLKLTGELGLDIARIEQVRAARPDVWMGVDANQGFVRAELDPLIDVLIARNISLLEQPLPRGAEADLTGLASPVPIAADESALSLADVPGLIGRFDVINIKLDKCGGLTEALRIVAEARRLGLGVMVGNMVGSSLAMAPAFLVAQLADFVDLDGPTFLAEDRRPGAVYGNGAIDCGEDVWGGGVRIAA